jgi:lysozyme family protein
MTQATYDAYRVKKPLGRRDVFTMGAAERDEIYRNEYRNAVNGDRLRAGEDLCVFDFAVNSGPARALEVWRRLAPPKALAKPSSMTFAPTGFRSCTPCAFGAPLGPAGGAV